MLEVNPPEAADQRGWLMSISHFSDTINVLLRHSLWDDVSRLLPFWCGGKWYTGFVRGFTDVCFHSPNVDSPLLSASPVPSLDHIYFSLSFLQELLPPSVLSI